MDIYTEALVIGGEEIALVVNAEKTKCMVISRDQNAGQNGNIRIGNKSFETVEQFKYLGTALANQNTIHEEQIEGGECLLSFGSESLVFQFTNQKCKE